MAWQVASVEWDDELGEVYSEHLTKQNVEPVTDLEIALSYALLKHVKQPGTAQELLDQITARAP